jgi:hypothetical protein
MRAAAVRSFTPILRGRLRFRLLWQAAWRRGAAESVRQGRQARREASGTAHAAPLSERLATPADFD